MEIMNSIIAVVCLMLLTTIFITFFSYSYAIGMNGISWYSLLNRKQMLIFLGFICLILLICIYLIIQNKFIYYWDYSGYWTYSYSQMKAVFEDPLSAFKNLYRSICYDDYNLTLPTLISIPLKIIGYTFNKYVLINVFCFFLPLVFILLSLSLKLTKKIVENHVPDTIENRLFIIGMLIFISSFTIFYLAVLRGYIDIAALVPASLACLLFVDYCPEKLDRKQIIRDFCISGCLLSTFLFRRYFAYFIVGYVCALVLYSLYRAIFLEKINRKQKLWISLCNLLIIAVISIAVMFVFFNPMLIHVLTNDYSGQYVAYDAPFKDKANRIIDVFGLWNVFLASLGIVISFIRKKFRKIVIFCGTAATTTVFAFFRVQNMGIQHVYTIALEIFILSAIGVWLLAELFQRKTVRRIVVSMCLVVAICGFLNCFFPKMRPTFSLVSKAFSEVYDPLQRNDIPVLHAMVNYLNSLIEGTDTKIYIDASGPILNNSIIDSLDKPYKSNPLHNICKTADVDLRDGFPIDFLSAGIVVTTTPVQLHLPKGTQEVVRFISQEISNHDSPIGRHFTKNSTVFYLDNGVIVNIYIKNSDFEDGDLHYLSDYFTNYYPGKETMFADRILSANKK